MVRKRMARRAVVTLICAALLLVLAGSVGWADNFQVSQNAYPDISPAIAYNSSNGEFLVVWEYEYSTTDHDIYAQRISANGSLVGGQIYVAFTTAFEASPAVAFNPVSGEYLVIWQRLEGSGDSAQNDIWAQRISSDGGLAGSAFPVSQLGANETKPVVCTNTSDGNYLVTWTYEYSSSDHDIYAQLVTSSGSPTGSLILVAASSQEEMNPSLAYAPSTGQYFVVWQKKQASPALYNIIGRFFGANGNPVDVEAAIVTGSFDLVKPRVVYHLEAGEFFVVWEDHSGGSGTERDIYGKRFDRHGSAVSGNIAISYEGTNYRENPDVAYNQSRGEYIVVWEYEYSASDHDVYYGRVAYNGGIIETDLLMSGLASTESHPAVACSNEFPLGMVVWEDGRNDATTSMDIYGGRTGADLSVYYANPGGSRYHLRSDAAPSEGLDYGILVDKGHLSSTTVQIELYRVGDTVPISTISMVEDLSSVAPESVKYVHVDFPLYDGQGPYELSEDNYFFKITLDPQNQIQEPDETNNIADSSPFDYRIYSGDLYFGPSMATMNSAQLTLDDPACSSGQVHINQASVTWTNTWGTESSAPSGLCATESINGDGYSMDLNVASGSAQIGIMYHNVSGLDVSVQDVTLESDGMHYGQTIVRLPDGVTIHERPQPGDRIGPIGSTILTLPPGNPVTDPSQITLLDPEEHYFHGYGLPFYLGVGGSMGGRITFALNADSTGIGLTSATPMYVHIDTWAELQENDRRKKYGLPSNDAMFWLGDPVNMQITDAGLQGNIGFMSLSSVKANTGIREVRTYFPYGNISWGNFTASLVNSQIASASLSGISFLMPFDGKCPECPGPNVPPSKTYQVDLSWVAMGSDGAFGGYFPGVGQGTSWGQVSNAGVTTYTKDDSSSPGILYFPGFIASGTANGSHSISQYLLGSREFQDVGFMGSISFQGEADASQGNGYYAGMTVGPQILEPAPDTGLTSFLNSSQLEILFGGNSVASAFDVTSRTKYVLRPGGLSGVFNTNFSGPLQVYGYTLHLLHFAFRQVLNRVDDDTFIHGYIDLPDPAGIRVAFNDLDLTCTGDFRGGQVDKEVPNIKGVDDDGDTLVDEGWYQALDYWNMPVDLIGMGFESPDGEMCPHGTQKLRLITSNQVNGISVDKNPKRLTLNSFWEPSGTPLKDQMTGPPQLCMDGPHDPSSTDVGFGIQIENGYLNRPMNGNWSGPDPISGFTALEVKTDVPLFDDPVIRGQLENGPVDASSGTVDPGSYNLWLFDRVSQDQNRDGIPDNQYSGLADMDTLRGALNCSEVDYSQCADVPNGPDPRPQVEYSWPSSGLVHLDYRLLYSKAGDTEGPQFSGIKKDTRFPSASYSADPIFSIYSVPEYLTPVRTKLTMGLSADVKQLKNWRIRLSTIGVRAFFKDVLGIDLNVDLDELFNLNETMRDLVGSDLTPLMEDALDESLSHGAIVDHMKDFSDNLKIVHGAPARVKALASMPMSMAREKAQGILKPLDASGKLLPTGLSQKLQDYYSDPELPGMIVYNPYNPPSTSPTTPIADLKKEMSSLAAKVASLEKALADSKSLLENSQKQLDALSSQLQNASNNAANMVSQIKASLDTRTDVISSDPGVNPILQHLATAQDAIKKVKDYLKDIKKIENTINEVATQAHKIGIELDERFIKDVVRWFRDKVPYIEAMLTSADVLYQQSLATLDLTGLFDPAKIRLNGVAASLTPLQNSLTNTINNSKDGIGVATDGLGRLISSLKRLHKLLSGGQMCPQGLCCGAGCNWSQLVDAGRAVLDQFAAETTAATLNDPTNATNLGSVATQLCGNNPGSCFLEYAQHLDRLIEAPLTEAGSKYEGSLNQANKAILKIMPLPGPEDIKTLIIDATLTSPDLRNLNSIFYAQFAFLVGDVTNIVDDLSTSLNRLIDKIIAAAADKALATVMQDSNTPIGKPGEGGLSAVKLDGYAVVSQDEIERFHLDGEFDLDTKPRPMKFPAGLDVARWRPINGRASACCPPGNGIIDVSIFTHDVPVKDSGIKIKTARVGFIVDDHAAPLGTFGSLYLKGSLKASSIDLKDAGLETGLSWQGGDPVSENYLGAKCWGKFSGYRIKAAFFVGQSCDTQVLSRLDPDYIDYLGTKKQTFSGLYVRGSGSFPIYDVGCLFEIGVGADVGIWYFRDPPAMWGGLLGGSVYGKVGCVCSAKGNLTLGGSKSRDDDFLFTGSGWAAAGFGFCDSGDWWTLEDSRNDDWCATWDASFKAKYFYNDWHITDTDISGPH